MSVVSGTALFLFALAGALVTCPLAGLLGRRLGLIDRPRPGELQKHQVPRSGGYGITVAFLIGIAASALVVERSEAESTRLVGFLLGLVPLLATAVLDDIFRLRPIFQAVGQMIAVVTALSFGLLIDNVSTPWGAITELSLWIAAPLTVVWVAGMINTVNLLDTMDGVAGGVAAIAAAVLLARTVDQGQYTIATLPLVLMAVCLGFLVFNFHPARIFMGSSGSMFLGYALAMVSLIGGAKIATAAMVLGLPILDVAFVIVARLSGGRSPFVGGDSTHLIHRLHAAGWSPRRIAVTFYALCALAGVLAMSLSRLEKLYLGAVVLVVFALVVALTVSRSARPAASLARENPQPPSQG